MACAPPDMAQKGGPLWPTYLTINLANLLKGLYYSRPWEGPGSPAKNSLKFSRDPMTAFGEKVIGRRVVAIASISAQTVRSVVQDSLAALRPASA